MLWRGLEAGARAGLGGCKGCRPRRRRRPPARERAVISSLSPYLPLFCSNPSLPPPPLSPPTPVLRLPHRPARRRRVPRHRGGTSDSLPVQDAARAPAPGHRPARPHPGLRGAGGGVASRLRGAVVGGACAWVCLLVPRPVRAVGAPLRRPPLPPARRVQGGARQEGCLLPGRTGPAGGLGGGGRGRRDGGKSRGGVHARLPPPRPPGPRRLVRLVCHGGVVHGADAGGRVSAGGGAAGERERRERSVGRVSRGAARRRSRGSARRLLGAGGWTRSTPSAAAAAAAELEARVAALALDEAAAVAAAGYGSSGGDADAGGRTSKSRRSKPVALTRRWRRGRVGALAPEVTVRV